MTFVNCLFAGNESQLLKRRDRRLLRSGFVNIDSTSPDDSVHGFSVTELPSLLVVIWVHAFRNTGGGLNLLNGLIIVETNIHLLEWMIEAVEKLALKGVGVIFTLKQQVEI